MAPCKRKALGDITITNTQDEHDSDEDLAPVRKKIRLRPPSDTKPDFAVYVDSPSPVTSQPGGQEITRAKTSDPNPSDQINLRQGIQEITQAKSIDTHSPVQINPRSMKRKNEDDTQAMPPPPPKRQQTRSDSTLSQNPDQQQKNAQKNARKPEINGGHAVSPRYPKTPSPNRRRVWAGVSTPQTGDNDSENASTHPMTHTSFKRNPTTPANRQRTPESDPEATILLPRSERLRSPFKVKGHSRGPQYVTRAHEAESPTPSNYTEATPHIQGPMYRFVEDGKGGRQVEKLWYPPDELTIEKAERRILRDAYNKALAAEKGPLRPFKAPPLLTKERKGDKACVLRKHLVEMGSGLTDKSVSLV